MGKLGHSDEWQNNSSVCSISEQPYTGLVNFHHNLFIYVSFEKWNGSSLHLNLKAWLHLPQYGTHGWKILFILTEVCNNVIIMSLWTMHSVYTHRGLHPAAGILYHIKLQLIAAQILEKADGLIWMMFKVFTWVIISPRRFTSEIIPLHFCQ